MVSRRCAWHSRPETPAAVSAFRPHFVVELRSPDDRLSRLRPKMREWVENGARLAWLIDPERRAVEISGPARNRKR
ncbi:MAG: Uma2 family endonuclease [Terriglobia bacterium]